MGNMTSAGIEKMEKDYKASLKKIDKKLEIRDLNKEFFASGLMKYEMGTISYTKADKITFTATTSGIVYKNVDVTTLYETSSKKDTKLNPKAILDGLKNYPCKRLVNQPCKFVIAAKDNMTLDGQPVNSGDVVLVEPVVRLQDNYRVFVKEVYDVVKPDQKNAVAQFKAGSRGPGVQTPRTQPWYDKGGVFIPNEIVNGSAESGFSSVSAPTTQPRQAVSQPKRRAVESEAPASVSVSGNGWKLTAKVVDYTSDGFVQLWGYQLTNAQGQKQQLSKADTLKMANNKQIDNAFVRDGSLAGKDGFSVNSLPEIDKI